MGKIIWLASYPKSGNTWIRAFLANLFADSEQLVGINALDRFCHSLTSRAPFDVVAGRPTSEMSPYEVLQLRDKVQRALCETFSESVFLKTHSRFGSQFGLPLIAPDCTAGAIYIVRDPIDVAASAANHYGVSAKDMVQHMADPDFRTAPSDKHVTEFIGSWSDNVASWTTPPHPKIRVLRYEDVFASPETVYAELVAFLGLKPTSEQMDRALRYSQFAALAEQERLMGFKERPAHAPAFFRRGRPGEGRETLDPELIGSIIAAHGRQMERFGYLANGAT